MSQKQSKQKIKIIQFKDVISIILILIIMFFSVEGILGTVRAEEDADRTVARDLIMFASLAYADLEKIKDYNVNVDEDINNLTFEKIQMVTDEELSSMDANSIPASLSEGIENTYDYLFYGLATTEEVNDWELVNYTKCNTTIIRGMGVFTAMTFKKDKDIVIAYRGTDFNDIGDWAQDLLYGLVGYAGQEEVAQKYARTVAEHYINEESDIKIYVTGHSLGGYLAQIGGAALVEKNSNYRNNVEEIAYFNGMGLKFWSNIGKRVQIPTIFGIDTNELNQLISDNSSINKTQHAAMNALRSWNNDGGKINPYCIKGDLVSALGSHVVEKISLDPANLCIKHHGGNQNYVAPISTLLLKTLNGLGFSSEDVSSYIEEYRPKTLINYVWMTHETDSFFGRLPYADGTQPADITVELEVPSTIKYNKKVDAKLIVTTKNAKIDKSSLTKSDFTVNTSKVKIDSVKIESITKLNDVGNNYKYVYNIKLKGGLIVGNSNIILKPGAIKLESIFTLGKTRRTNELFKEIVSNLSNNIFESSSIKTKLR